jgi:hypothetical protein
MQAVRDAGGALAPIVRAAAASMPDGEAILADGEDFRGVLSCCGCWRWPARARRAATGRASIHSAYDAAADDAANAFKHTSVGFPT